MLADRAQSCVVLVDVQPSFLQSIDGSQRVLSRSRFLLEIAKLLGVPVLATEQYPSRMGGTEEDLVSYLNSAPISKMCFSCAESPQFVEELRSTSKQQIVLVGIETHICVNQTAHHLLQLGYEVIVAADAVGSRTSLMHEMGLKRMGAAGITLAHSESVAYEWLHSAEDPKFREALAIVKRSVV